jgi:hypothetical protein
MVRGPRVCSWNCWRHYSRRPRKRSCDSMMCSSSCARFNPARALFELLVCSFSIRRPAASTRSRARSKSTTVYCRDCGGVCFPRDPFETLFAKMAGLGCFTVDQPSAGDPPKNGHYYPPSRQQRQAGAHGHAAHPTIHKVPRSIAGVIEMANERMERRLSAILAADIAGYSALMGADEARTVNAYRPRSANWAAASDTINRTSAQ